MDYSAPHPRDAVIQDYKWIKTHFSRLTCHVLFMWDWRSTSSCPKILTLTLFTMHFKNQCPTLRWHKMQNYMEKTTHKSQWSINKGQNSWRESFLSVQNQCSSSKKPETIMKDNTFQFFQPFIFGCAYSSQRLSDLDVEQAKSMCALSVRDHLYIALGVWWKIYSAYSMVIFKRFPNESLLLGCSQVAI